MPVVQVDGTNLSYALIAFDEQGRERFEDDGTLLSAKMQARISNESITDVFLMSHGWRGDVPAARSQYDRWIKAMAACIHDVDRIRQAGASFQPLLIGLHWPSEPFGDESLAAGGLAGFVAGAVEAAADTVGTV